MNAELEKLFDKRTLKALTKIGDELGLIADAIGDNDRADNGRQVNRIRADIERWAIDAKLKSLQRVAGIEDGDGAGRE